MDPVNVLLPPQRPLVREDLVEQQRAPLRRRRRLAVRVEAPLGDELRPAQAEGAHLDLPPQLRQLTGVE